MRGASACDELLRGHDADADWCLVLAIRPCVQIGASGIYESDRVLSASSLARYDHRALSDDEDDLLGLG